MADTKISNLTALAEAPATGDLFAVVDVSASETKKLTVANLIDAVEATAIVFTASVDVDNLKLDGNTLSSTSGAVTVTPLAGQNVALTTSGGGLSEVVNSTLATLRLRNTDSTLVGQQVIGEIDFYGSDASASATRTGIYANIGTLAVRSTLASATDLNGAANEGGDLVFSTATDTVGSTALVLTEAMRLTQRGRLGINNNDPTYRVDVVGTGQITQSSTTAAHPALYLSQSDVSEGFVDYVGTSAASAAGPISTWTVATLAGYVRCEINGAAYWMPFYNAPTA